MKFSLPRVFAIAMMAIGFASASADAQDAALLYNPADGNVQIQINNALINLFSIESRLTDGTDGDLFRIDANIDPVPFGAPEASTDDGSIIFNDTNPFAVGTFDLGDIFLANLSFNNFVTPVGAELTEITAADGTALGFGALSFTVTGTPDGPGGSFQVPFQVVSSIPEPATLPLLVMGASAFLTRRRKR